MGAVIFSNDLRTSWTLVCSLAANNDVPLYLITYEEQVADDFEANCLTKAFVITSEVPPQNSTSANDATVAEDDAASEDLAKCTKYLEQRAQLDLILLSFPSIISPSVTIPAIVSEIQALF